MLKEPFHTSEVLCEFKKKLKNVIHLIKQKKKLVFLFCALIILFSATLFSHFAGKNGTPAVTSPEKNDVSSAKAGLDNAAAEDETVEVLPQEERVGEEGLLPPDPFAAPPQLMGVLLDGEGEDYAIIEVGGRAYVKTEGEIVADLWKVESIFKDKVKIVSETDELVLLLSR